ncbi:MAG: thiol reductant ABC exporter subunit CydC [Dermatophilaceae bacterium]
MIQRPVPLARVEAVDGPVPVARATLVAGLLGGAATASGIALTATSGWLVVRASERPVILTLLVAIVAVRAFGMARPVVRYLERLVSHDAALGDLAHRRSALYACLVPLAPARLGRRSRSAVLTGVVDDLTDTVEAGVRVTVPVLSGAVAGVVATLLTAWFDPAVGLVVAALLVLVALACILAWRLESRSLPALLAARGEVQRVADLVARQAGELRGIGAEAAASRWLAQAHDEARRAVRRQSHGRALVAAVLLLGTGAATVASALLVRPDDVGAPVAALLVVVPVAVGDALAPLTDSMRALARAQGSAARVAALTDQEPAGTDPAPVALRRPGTVSHPTARRPAAPGDPETPGHPAAPRHPGGSELRLDEVTASWTGARTDLAATSVAVRPGRRVAVVGPNGSGKSTLLAVLARQLDRTGGRHTLDGTDVRDLRVAETRAAVAVLDDEPHVLAATIRDNLRLAQPDAVDSDLTDALRLAGLGDWYAGLPSGLDTRLGTGGRGVSGGERTRLGLARALLSRRGVILLDEPTAHLDPPTAARVLDDMLDATTGRGVVIVTHRPEALDRVEEVLDLGAGMARSMSTAAKE